jgi:hypothetical protein
VSAPVWPPAVDDCAVSNPPAPCLSAVNDAVTYVNDPIVLWGLLLLGLIFGFIICFVTLVPYVWKSRYREGLNAGMSKRLLGQGLSIHHRPGPSLDLDWAVYPRQSGKATYTEPWHFDYAADAKLNEDEG